MEQLLLRSVLDALAPAFSDAIIVTEQVQQGFSAPCFCLTLENCSLHHELADRYRGDADFSLIYYPKSEDTVASAIVPDQVQTALSVCPGFSAFESSIADDSSVTMRFRLSALAFRSGEQPVFMGKLALSLSFENRASL